MVDGPVEKLIASIAQPLERTHGPFQAVHPIIRKFPALGDDDYGRLRDDMQKNGQRKAVGIYQGYIWDGRARYDVCRDLQIIPKIWILRVREPIIYLLQRHRDRFGLPQTPEREAALEVLRDVDRPEWKSEVRRRRDDWLKFARDEFRQTVRVARPCAACGLDREYSHAHHSVPLGVQYEMGLNDAIQDHDWLCAVHHKMVHKMWSSALTPTFRNFEASLTLKYAPEPKRTHSLAAVAVFERGFMMFTDMGGVSQGRHWEMVRP